MDAPVFSSGAFKKSDPAHYPGWQRRKRDMSSLSSKLKRRNVLKGTLAVAAAPAIITSAKAQAKVTWKVQSHWPKASGSFTDSLGVLAKELEAKTDGRFKLELLGAGEIAKGGEIFNVVRRGVVQMGTTSPAYNLNEAELMSMYMGIPGALREPWEAMHMNKNLEIGRASCRDREKLSQVAG